MLLSPSRQGPPVDSLWIAISAVFSKANRGLRRGEQRPRRDFPQSSSIGLEWSPQGTSVDVLQGVGRGACAAGSAVASSPAIHRMRPAVIHASSRHQLFPSASRLRRHRRDADHGRARGGGAICERVAGRAHASAGALAEAARSRAGRDRELAGHRALHLLEQELATRLEKTCRDLGVPCLSILGPVLQLFQAYLGGETKPRVGAQHTLNAEYFKRIDALNYTMLHDDGQHVDDLEQADVVLVGVSRTSKTPTSIYLANRGVKTANIPLVPGVPVPPQSRNPDAAAGGRPHRQPRADRADPPEPAARASRRARGRPICRPAGGGGRDRGGAQALRPAQLADHRRDAPLDRGNRRRSDGAARRAPPAVRPERRAIDAAVACCETLDAGVEKRRAPRGAGGGRHPDRDRARRYRRARRSRRGPSAQGPGDGRGTAGAREGAGGGGASIPTAWCSAPTRRWRWASGGSPRRPTARRRASSSRRCAAKTHSLHSAVAVVRGGTALFEHVDAAHLTMREFLRRVSRQLSRCGGRQGDCQRRRLSARGRRHPAVRARRGRSFHRARPAAVAAARTGCGDAGLLAK